ncbi:helix-turn-helix domain-containing protein [Nocardia sp. NPDC006630]|uniref:PucR family transcriptional regulator n=1 Tax=Nocardia sp. NPDC006630 TaxID=3157181 RepID=UPI0033BA0386
MCSTSSVEIAQLAQACRGEIAALTDKLIAAVFTDNPEWTDYTSVPRAELHDACGRYLARILDLLSDAQSDPQHDEVAATIGKHRAAQNVPLEAMLRTFRLGGRIVWEALLDNAEAVDISPGGIRDTGTAMWTVIDGLSSALSTAYRNSELDRVRQDERRKHALMEDLLTDRMHDAAFLAHAARELNLPTHSGYIVVVAESLPTGCSTLLGAETTLEARGIRSAWHNRAHTTIGLVALEQWDAVPVREFLRPLTRGRAACSPTVQSLAEVNTAHGLAHIVLRTLPIDTVALVSMDERYPEALLVRSPDLADLLLSHILGPVLRLPVNDRDALLGTLSQWLAQNCSATNAAARLHCHRNTVLNRLHRISTLIGRPLDGQRTYFELTLALIAFELSCRAA